MLHSSFYPESPNVIACALYPQDMAKLIIHFDCYHQLVVTIIIT